LVQILFIIFIFNSGILLINKLFQRCSNWNSDVLINICLNSNKCCDLILRGYVIPYSKFFSVLLNIMQSHYRLYLVVRFDMNNLLRLRMDSLLITQPIDN